MCVSARSYYSQYPGLYCTGDGAVVDNDGYYWVTGRLDDVINVRDCAGDAVLYNDKMRKIMLTWCSDAV